MKSPKLHPGNQNSDISGKIIAGLERISDAFKVLLWEKAKVLRISPIQIQILIFIAYHKGQYCSVSNLAEEFNLTKATISDAVRILNLKEFIVKDYSSSDNRSYVILLSEKGKGLISEIESFSQPLKDQLKEIPNVELEYLFTTLSKLIYQLNKTGILKVQRTCYGCVFYDKIENKDYCNLMNKELLNSEIRLDCPEFEKK